MAQNTDMKMWSKKVSPGNGSLTQSQMHEKIRERAQKLFEKRGRTAGRELDDWLEAEKMVKQEMKSA